MTAPLLEVRDLCRVFPLQDGGKVHAVEQVSFRLGHGETLALVGESGCGKSTTARLVCRLDQATSGQIVLDGTDISRLSPRAMRANRRQMQMVFQDPFASLNPRQSVGNAVSEPLLVHGLMRKGPELRQVVSELFTRVGLSPTLMDQFPHQFSGGQRQRICIARALALRPKLVIADEAVSALDVSVQAQVINLMMELQQDLKLSYLFISHDLAVVERMAHRVALMYLGQIVEIGPRRSVFENPQHSYTKRLLDAAPIADPARRRSRNLHINSLPSPALPHGQGPERVILEERAPGHFAAREID